jgi:hypothetical protein
VLAAAFQLSIAKQVPSKMAEVDCVFSAGREDFLRSQFTALGFSDIQIKTESTPFHFGSFEAYFDGVEEYVALPEEIRRLVREDVRRSVAFVVNDPTLVQAVARAAPISSRLSFSFCVVMSMP